VGVRAASVAAVASLLLIAGGLIAAAGQRERHQLGSNWVRPVTVAAEVRADERLCQPGMQLPARAGGVGLRARTSERTSPELALTIRAAGQPVVRGTLPAGWREGDIVVPIPELAGARRDARVCVEHAGPGRIAFWGGLGTGEDAEVDGRAQDGMVRLEYVEAERRSWFPVVGAMADRLAVARDALPGAAALPLFGLVALAVVAASLLLVVREGRR
jgi:hypothetical protein